LASAETEAFHVEAGRVVVVVAAAAAASYVEAARLAGWAVLA
jgi:hypothetical protein